RARRRRHLRRGLGDFRQQGLQSYDRGDARRAREGQVNLDARASSQKENRASVFFPPFPQLDSAPYTYVLFCAFAALHPMTKPSFPLQVKAVMIDLDGTLVDSIPDLAAAANGMLRELGRAELDIALVRTFVGKGIPNLVSRSLTGKLDGQVSPEALAQAMPIYERWYTEMNGKHCSIYPGVMEG